MTHYLIDIHLMGSVKHQIPNVSNHLQEKFNIGDKLVTRISRWPDLFRPRMKKNSSKISLEYVRIKRRFQNIRLEVTDFLMV
jgi:hypothetical protein